MCQESVLMVSHADALPETTLLFSPEAIISVKSAGLDREYIQNVDWVLEGGKVRLTPTSQIPYLTDEDLYYPQYMPGTTMPKTDGGAVLYREGAFFHDRQIVITYLHAENQWTGVTPQPAAAQLPVTFGKLCSAEPLRLVAFGDSISVGANCSGYTGVPPYLPVWGQLIANELEKFYGSPVAFINESVGGTTSQWGAEQAHNAARWSPDLVMIGFGMNDGSGTGKADGVSPSVYGRNIRWIIDRIRQTNPAAEFILVGTTLPNAETIFMDQQPFYYPELERIACELPGVAAANMTAVHSQLLRRKAFLDMTGNNINHPNDFLNRCYAQFIAEMLKPNRAE